MHISTIQKIAASVVLCVWSAELVRFTPSFEGVVVPLTAVAIVFILGKGLTLAVLSKIGDALDWLLSAIFYSFLAVIGFVAIAIVRTETAIDAAFDRYFAPLLERVADKVDPEGKVSEAMTDIVQGNELSIDRAERFAQKRLAVQQRRALTMYGFWDMKAPGSEKRGDLDKALRGTGESVDFAYSRPLM